MPPRKADFLNPCTRKQGCPIVQTWFILQSNYINYGDSALEGTVFRVDSQLGWKWMSYLNYGGDGRRRGGGEEGGKG